MKLFVLLALIGTALAVPRSSNRIVGGSVTTVEQYPFMANLQYAWWGIFWVQSCGGTLITSNTILSAAHCVEGDIPSEWRVRLGTSFASSGGTIYIVTQLVIHPSYVSNALDPDLAILRLSSPAQLSASVGIARIASRNFDLPDGTVTYSIGWGAVSVGGPSSEQLRHVDVNIINHQLCTQRYAILKTQPNFANWPDVTPGMLCAGILDVGGKDACQGDSGGPLVYNGDILIGVTSWGYRCADPFYPGVNARVSYYSDWIVSVA